MPDLTAQYIRELSAAAALADANVMPVDQGGDAKKVTLTTLRTYTQIGLGAAALSNSYNDLDDLPSLFDGAFASLSGKPTTLSGYGITDAYPLVGNPSGFLTSAPVSSVFGRTGAVVAALNDYTWAQIDKTISSLADITTRSASDLSSGTLPDARFPATLPAASGVNLTALNGSNVTTGTIAAARGGAGTVSGILKANGSGVVSAAVAGTDYLSGNQTITLSGDMSGSGTVAITTAIGATKVTSAMLNADVFSTAHSWAGQQTFVAPILGTPASGTLTNCTGLPPVAGIVGWPANASGVLTNNGSGTLSWAATGGSGTVTSVAQSFTGGLISVSGSPVTTNGTLALTVAGTSGGVPYFSSTSSWASSALLAANAIMIGGGAGAAPATTTTGTGVVTALAVNVGSAGAVVVNGGALGTPSSGTLTSATGLPISTGVSGMGTGVATFLATPSSANLASAVTDETGSGALVFGTSPTLTGGTHTALTGLAIRSTGAAFDLTFATAEVFTAGRTLSFVLGDAARTLTIGASASVSGTNTGDQTSVTGNAGTATALQNARTINGTSFDGTANITVTAAAGTLTGTALNATVVTSSLTSHGTITSGGLGAGAVIGGVTMTLGSDATGDIYYRSAGGALTRLGIGSSTQVLTVSGGLPTWAAAGGGSGLTVGTTTVTSGTGGRLFYETAGNVLGEVSGATSNGTAVTFTSGNLLATSPAITTQISDANGNAMVSFNPTASATTSLQITNAINAGGVTLAAFGGGTNEDLRIGSKGSGSNTDLTQNAISRLRVSSSTVLLRSDYTFGWNSTNLSGGSQDLFLRRAAAANLAFGAVDAASPVAQTLSVQSVVAGTSNTAGVDWTLKGSQGTGTGAGGNIIFQAAGGGSSGTAQNALATALTIQSNGPVVAVQGYSSSNDYQLSAVSVLARSSANLQLGNASFWTSLGIYTAAVQRLGFDNSGIATWGAADAAAPVAQTQKAQSVVAGTSNTVGAAWTRKSSAGTGSSSSGAHVWQVAPAGSSGTSQNAFVEAFRITGEGGMLYPTTLTTTGTTGNQTINKVTGTVNIAAAGTTVTVTNSFCTANSYVFAVIRTNDATARIANIVPGAGSFVINIVACTAEVSIAFWVIN